MRADAAAKCRIYVDLEALTPPKEIMSLGGGQSPSPSMIWYAQAALWVQEDVCRAIAQVNQSSKSVETSPIKRLLSFTMLPGGAMYVRSPADPNSVPTGVTDPNGGSPNNNEPKVNYALSPTGRSSNSMYDVIGFKLVLHVDQTRIPEILKALAKDRFITVLGMDITRVDTRPQKEKGFLYGPAPIAEISLDCEALQLREWTVPWMPKTVKDSLIGPGVEYVFALKKPEDAKPAQGHP